MRQWVVWDIELMDQEEKEKLCGTQVEEICASFPSVIQEGGDGEADL